MPLVSASLGRFSVCCPRRTWSCYRATHNERTSPRERAGKITYIPSEFTEKTGRISISRISLKSMLSPHLSVLTSDENYRNLGSSIQLRLLNLPRHEDSPQVRRSYSSSPPSVGVCCCSSAYAWQPSINDSELPPQSSGSSMSCSSAHWYPASCPEQSSVHG